MLWLGLGVSQKRLRNGSETSDAMAQLFLEVINCSDSLKAYRTAEKVYY